MKKLDLKDICTAPPQKWLAIPRNGQYRPQIFSLDDVQELENGCLEFWPQKGLPLLPLWIHLLECHLCPSTGYTDSKGDEVFGGHLFRFDLGGGDTFLGMIVWNDHRWAIADLERSGDIEGIDDYTLKNGQLSDPTIGHIHIQPWPDEVKELLE